MHLGDSFIVLFSFGYFFKNLGSFDIAIFELNLGYYINFMSLKTAEDPFFSVSAVFYLHLFFPPAESTVTEGEYGTFTPRSHRSSDGLQSEVSASILLLYCWLL